MESSLNIAMRGVRIGQIVIGSDRHIGDIASSRVFCNSFLATLLPDNFTSIFYADCNKKRSLLSTVFFF